MQYGTEERSLRRSSSLGPKTPAVFRINKLTIRVSPTVAQREGCEDGFLHAVDCLSGGQRIAMQYDIRRIDVAEAVRGRQFAAVDGNIAARDWRDGQAGGDG